MSDRIAEPLPSTPDAAPLRRSSPWRNRIWAWVDPLSIAALYLYLLSHSWLCWLEPLIDFPRDLYIAWRLSEGDLLYQNLANWYGPLASLIEGAGFHVFGVGLDTMVWMNILLATAVLWLLREIFRALGSPFMGWLAPVVFLLVFAFGHFVWVANYNFITPYVAQSTYSFLGLLLLIWGLLRHLRSSRPAWLGVAGLGLAVSYLDKPEALLAGLGALGLYFLAQRLRARREGVDAGHWLRHYIGWVSGGFFCLWLPVFVYFVAHGGLAFGWRAVNFAPYTIFGGAFGSAVADSNLQLKIMGFDEPGKNFLVEFRAGSELALVCLVMTVAAWQWTRMRAGSGWSVGYLLVVAAPVFVGLWLLPRELFWLNLGSSFAIPVCLAAAGYAGWSLWAAWRGRAEFEHILGVAVLGVAGSLMLARMILSARLGHFGFVLMPLAVLFWIHLIVVEAARPRPGNQRRNWLLPTAFSLIVLTGAGELGRISLDVYAMKTYRVGTGRDLFYTFAPSVDNDGWLLRTMITTSRLVAPNARTLVVFPEGIAVNYELRVRSPLAEMEFHPLALSYVGPEHVLDELKNHPPDLVFLCARNMTEDGVLFFGADEASGRSIIRWLAENYKIVGYGGSSPYSITHHAVDSMLPNNAVAPQPQSVPADKE